MRTIEVQFETDMESHDMESLRLDAAIGRVARLALEVAAGTVEFQQQFVGRAVIAGIVMQRNDEAHRMWRRQEDQS